MTILVRTKSAFSRRQPRSTNSEERASHILSSRGEEEDRESAGSELNYDGSANRKAHSARSTRTRHGFSVKSQRLRTSTADIHPAHRNTAYKALTTVPEGQTRLSAMPEPLQIRRPISKEPVTLTERIEELSREVGRLEDKLQRQTELICRLEERIRRQIEMKNFVLGVLYRKEMSEKEIAPKVRRRSSLPDVTVGRCDIHHERR